MLLSPRGVFACLPCCSHLPQEGKHICTVQLKPVQDKADVLAHGISVDAPGRQQDTVMC